VVGGCTRPFGREEERSVDVKVTEFKVHGGRNGKEESKTDHANDQGESFRIVEAHALTAVFGHKAGFKTGDTIHNVGLYLLHPHVIDDRAVWGKFDRFPRTIDHEGGVLLLQRGLPFRCLIA
jgi:hypothetical protein